ncbi:hypothetical protein [Mycobacteroides abscessus]|uniref:hypothetical protein n=1 Tax=Mycobacteroides abscessus TaxID=36809 RepID=UPI0009A8F8ED|nr:hypothetical protein [Mycobacteroides abscessus]SKO15360.1 Uncharacterised protein [Mycobacteroides abscessus subsp. bolletii]SKX37362.1 Uncharacterised protein [Mycobacteroides abscessus subsp. bolletii]
MKTATLTQSRRTQCTRRLTADERSILAGPPPRTASLPIEAVPAYLREEWEHFKGYGWSDHHTADRLGIKRDTFKTWAPRYARRLARIQERAQREATENLTLTAYPTFLAAQEGATHTTPRYSAIEAIAC